MEEFEKNKSLMIAIAYRSLGSLSEAEEVVQEVAIEWLKQNSSDINNPKAWLVKVTTNKSLDAIKRAYKKREVYKGIWLPEIMPETTIYWDDPQELRNSLKVSFLLILEKLGPKERIVYLLRHVFEYSHKEIAGFLDIDESNSRKIFQKANKLVSEVDHEEDKATMVPDIVIQQLFEAIGNSDRDKIIELLEDDAKLYSDGGGKVIAAWKVIESSELLSKFLVGIYNSPKTKDIEYKYDFIKVNGCGGLIIYEKSSSEWELETILSFESRNQKISKIYAQRNPDKLLPMSSKS